MLTKNYMHIKNFILYCIPYEEKHIYICIYIPVMYKYIYASIYTYYICIFKYTQQAFENAVSRPNSFKFGSYRSLMVNSCDFVQIRAVWGIPILNFVKICFVIPAMPDQLTVYIILFYYQYCSKTHFRLNVNHLFLICHVLKKPTPNCWLLRPILMYKCWSIRIKCMCSDCHMIKVQSYVLDSVIVQLIVK